MQEPGARIVRHPSYHHLLPRVARAYHVAANWVHVVEGTVARALYDIKGMLMIMSVPARHAIEVMGNLPREGVWNAGSMLYTISHISVEGIEKTYGSSCTSR
jgi:hypothetical protein